MTNYVVRVSRLKRILFSIQPFYLLRSFYLSFLFLSFLSQNKPQLIKPIAFKPIPFPADSRCFMNGSNSNNNNTYEASDRYGSTPSLNPPINNYNLKFGSTHDLRNHFNTIGSRKAYAYNINNNNLINYDSMESISPDSIGSSQSTL